MLLGLFFITLSVQNLFYLTIALSILGISVGLGNPSLNSLLSKNLNKNIIGTSFRSCSICWKFSKNIKSFSNGQSFLLFWHEFTL